jgi:hypothetical protein
MRMTGGRKLSERDEAEDGGMADQGADAKRRPRRRRKQRPFPASSFKEASELAEAMVEMAGGGREVRRVTLFDHLGHSPESGPSRQAVTNSARFGLTEGSYQAETLTLTDDGFRAVNPESSPRERARAQFYSTVTGVEGSGRAWSPLQTGFRVRPST